MVPVFQYFWNKFKALAKINFSQSRQNRNEVCSLSYIICNAQVDNPVFRYVMKQVAAKLRRCKQVELLFRTITQCQLLKETTGNN